MVNRTFIFQAPFFAHTGGTTSICFSSDSNSVLTSGYDTKTRIWDLSGQELECHEGVYRGISVFVNQDKQVFTGGADPPRVYDRNSWTRLLAPRRLDNIWAIAVDNTNNKIAISNNNLDDEDMEIRPLQIRSTKSWRVRETINFPIVGPGSFVDICGLSFSSDGRYLAVATSPDSSVRIWSFKQNKFVDQFKPQKGPSFACAYSADGTFILTGGYDMTVRLWNTQSWVLESELAIKPRPVAHTPDAGESADSIISGACSFDGRYIAVGTLAGYAYLWMVNET
jgi:WD40 repeat protein